jgi:signal transduction histidine kinase/ActR/RegA family two-component response regulator
MSELDGLKLLRRIEEGVAGKSGEAFFRQIICELAGALGAHAAFTSRLNSDRTASMLAFWVDGRFETCLNYSLAGTPCEFVYQGKISAFPRNIGAQFPVDREWFETLGVKSYLGIPIKGETGDVFGHLAVMDTRERDWLDADVDVLRLFSLRSAVELERGLYHRSLEEANAALKSAIGQLTEEIAQRQRIEAQLAAAKIAAEAANQAKSVFITQMSHELRTPLNGILGYAQLLKRNGSRLEEGQLEAVNVIERSGEHLLTLVNDLLDLAKIEAGKLELRRESVDIYELLQHVCDLIRVRAKQADLVFRLEENGKLPRHVIGDGRAVRQLLINLLGNAVKFTPRGGRVTLRVNSEAIDDSHIRLRFHVEDTGIGIPSEQLRNIFEPFHRVREEGQPAEGTGLGLAISKRIAEAMGARIDVVSRVGEGSVFEFALQTEIDGESFADRGLERVVVGYEGPRVRVLVADDDAVNRALLHRLLTQLGFDVQTASHGAEALELLRLASPHLLITDLLMPVLDGLELVRAIRADSKTKTIPVIAASASASEYTKEQALGEGCDAFVLKPLRMDELLGEIARLLQLEWRYDEQQRHANHLAIEAIGGSYSLEASLAAELYELAMQGDVARLGARLEEDLADNPDARDLYQTMRALADQYDMAAIRKLLNANADGISLSQ